MSRDEVRGVKSMNEKPILFSTPMVQAILAGRKTMTRRVIKDCISCDDKPVIQKWGIDDTVIPDKKIFGVTPTTKNAPWQVGEILWVRETWTQLDMDYQAVTGKLDIDEFKECPIAYKADGTAPEHFNYWRPSIFMPHKAARLFLEVTNIRVERLQEITENDAKTEGITSYWADPHKDTPPFIGAAKGLGEDLCQTRREAFEQLWDKLNAKRGYGWDLNPWCWVIEFERVEGESIAK